MRSRAKGRAAPLTVSRNLQTVFLGATLALTLSLATADAAVVSPSIRNDIASINIQTSAATYSAGQPILRSRRNQKYLAADLCV